jgi:hypothetical protein
VEPGAIARGAWLAGTTAAIWAAALLPIVGLGAFAMRRLPIDAHWTERARIAGPRRLALAVATFVTFAPTLPRVLGARLTMAAAACALAAATYVLVRARGATIARTLMGLASTHSRWLVIPATVAAGLAFTPRRAALAEIGCIAALVAWQYIAPWRASFMATRAPIEWERAVNEAARRVGAHHVRASVLHVNGYGPRMWSPTEVSATPTMLVERPGAELDLEGAAVLAIIGAQSNRWRHRYAAATIALGAFCATPTLVAWVGRLATTVVDEIAFLVFSWSVFDAVLEAIRHRARALPIAPLAVARYLERLHELALEPIGTRPGRAYVYDWLVTAGVDPGYPRPAPAPYLSWVLLAACWSMFVTELALA